MRRFSRLLGAMGSVGAWGLPLESVGLGNRRLQIGRSGPFSTVFLPHSRAMGLQIRQKLSSLGPILVKPPVFAFDAPSPTAS